MEILDKMMSRDTWQDFLKYKMEKGHLSKAEQKELDSFINNEIYIPLLQDMKNPAYCPPIPVKREINKKGISKKRVVYSYPVEFNILLKMTAYLLYCYDDLFEYNCYAFRRNYGAGDAIRRIRMTKKISEKYCLKSDISNYFNSIHVGLLLKKLEFLKENDKGLFLLFEKLLTADQAYWNGKTITEKRGAMAGIPVSPFLANVYLMELDQYFAEKEVLYFRYSDDILIFADTKEELCRFQKELYDRIQDNHLLLNPAKVKISSPGEEWEFLGFCYRNGKVDLSENTKCKIKGKIKRKAHALRRWQAEKGLSGEKAAKGFIKAMNHILFDGGEGTEFSWSRWFFPNLTTDVGLKEMDAYLQQYIRYCVTGRHYKGNYRITYEQMKEWGYRNLVYEYYQSKRDGKKQPH